jgi:hypothetical protein
MRLDWKGLPGANASFLRTFVNCGRKKFITLAQNLYDIYRTLKASMAACNTFYFICTETATSSAISRLVHPVLLHRLHIRDSRPKLSHKRSGDKHYFSVTDGGENKLERLSKSILFVDKFVCFTSLPTVRNKLACLSEHNKLQC